MINIVKPKARLLALSEDKRTAVFRFEDILKGMGVSLGNSIVRTLLTYIPGYAPQSYNAIVGTTTIGKYDAIPSCIENEADLSRNISAIRLMSKKDNIKNFTLIFNPSNGTSTKDKKEIKAGDLKVASVEYEDGTTSESDNSVVVLNPELVLLTRGSEVTSDKNDNTSIIIEIRCGYSAYFSSSNEPNKVADDERNFMTVTSIYSPVTAAHAVTSEGNNRLYENLEITVSTTGAISPSEAVSIACKIISTYSSMIGSTDRLFPIPRSYNNTEAVSAEFEKKIEDLKVASDSNENTPIEDAGFSSIVYNYLKLKGVRTLGEISRSAAVDANDELVNLILNSRSGVYASDTGTAISSSVNSIKTELLNAGFKQVTDKK